MGGRLPMVGQDGFVRFGLLFLAVRYVLDRHRRGFLFVLPHPALSPSPFPRRGTLVCGRPR
jgi:hypothetical protein